MFNIDVDGNGFILGLIAVLFGTEKAVKGRAKGKVLPVVFGCAAAVLGLYSMCEAVKAWFDKDAKEDDDLFEVEEEA